MDEYVELKEELESTWNKKFVVYFDESTHTDSLKNFIQLDTGKLTVFDNIKITNNLSESFHSSFKRVFKGQQLDRTEHVLIALFIYQVHRIQEFDRALEKTGSFSMKPQFSDLKLKSTLSFSVIDFDVLHKNAKTAIREFDPKVIENRNENITNKEMANLVLKQSKVGFCLINQDSFFIIGHPFIGNQEQLVKCDPDGNLTCPCQKKENSDCFHIIAAKLSSGHKRDIKDSYPAQKLGVVARKRTGESIGGRKAPRLMDLDLDDRQFDNFSKQSKLESVAEFKVQKPRRTYSKTTTQSSTFHLVSNEGDQLNTDLKAFVESGYNELLQDSEPDFSNELSILDSPKRTYAQSDCNIVPANSFLETFQAIYPFEFYSIKELRTSSKLDHGYCKSPLRPKEIKKSPFVRFDELCSELPVTDHNPVSNFKSSIKLANSITPTLWLWEDMVNEFAEYQIVTNGLCDSIFLIDSFFYSDVCRCVVEDSIISRLEFADAATKEIFLVVMNTDPVKRVHWFLGIVLFKKKMIVICDSIRKPLTNYKKAFTNLYKIVLLTFFYQKKQTKVKDWKFCVCDDVAQQHNTYDYGVFVCFFIKQILSGQSLETCNHIDKRNYLIDVLKREYPAYPLTGQRNRFFTKSQLYEIMHFTFDPIIELISSKILFSQNVNTKKRNATLLSINSN